MTMVNLINLVVIDYGDTLSSAPYFRAAPPQCPEWPRIVDEYLFAKGASVFDDWMSGSLKARDVAELLAPHLRMDASSVEAHLRRGCRNLSLNPGVVAFAEQQRRLGRRTALVTCNIDLFTEVIVADQGLDRLFDVIVSSSDHGDIRKDFLWPRAFERLGPGHGYATTFALDDNPAMVALFSANGGRTHRYTGDLELEAWLRSDDPTARLLMHMPAGPPGSSRD